jgi:hypothetical protein
MQHTQYNICLDVHAIYIILYYIRVCVYMCVSFHNEIMQSVPKHYSMQDSVSNHYDQFSGSLCYIIPLPPPSLSLSETIC